MREKLETLILDQLREMAKEKGFKASSKTKGEIIDLLMEEYEKNPVKEQNEKGEYCDGIFEIVEEAKCGFIRCENFLPGANDVYVIRKDDGTEELVPDVPQFINNIDIKARQIRIDFPEWL